MLLRPAVTAVREHDRRADRWWLEGACWVQRNLFQELHLYTGVVLALHAGPWCSVQPDRNHVALPLLFKQQISRSVCVWARVAVHRLSSPYMSRSTGDQAAAAQVPP